MRRRYAGAEPEAVMATNWRRAAIASPAAWLPWVLVGMSAAVALFGAWWIWGTGAAVTFLAAWWPWLLGEPGHSVSVRLVALVAAAEAAGGAAEIRDPRS